LLFGFYSFLTILIYKQKLKRFEMRVTDLIRIQKKKNNKIINSDNALTNTYLPVCHVKFKDNIHYIKQF
jgi:hypothetical protein